MNFINIINTTDIRPSLSTTLSDILEKVRITMLLVKSSAFLTTNKISYAPSFFH